MYGFGGSKFVDSKVAKSGIAAGCNGIWPRAKAKIRIRQADHAPRSPAPIGREAPTVRDFSFSNRNFIQPERTARLDTYSTHGSYSIQHGLGKRKELAKCGNPPRRPDRLREHK
jgi:hypothetical protein